MKYLILGAGPAGLTFANRLRQLGEKSFLVLEKENVAGGLCRSVEVDGSPFDIGGGHFLDVRYPWVDEFLFQFMSKDEWDIYDADSRIKINDNLISYPIEANIWQMKIEEQVEYLKSIAIAGCNLSKPMPEKFVHWIYWKLGSKIANDYMIPYNQKMFLNELNELGTYWLEKLPKVSFEETLLSCLEKKAYGIKPGHEQFYYPKKYGYGELWLRMAKTIDKNIEYGKTVKEIDMDTLTVITSDGEKYTADIIITTIPWMEIREFSGIPNEIRNDIGKLKYSSIETRYYKDSLNTDAQWIYYPAPELAYHRILVRHNFCPGSRGYWTETRNERVELIPDEEQENFHYLNRYAYPLNTIGKPLIMKKLLSWAGEHDVYGLGRWGEHQHYNSDTTVSLAMKMAENLFQ